MVLIELARPSLVVELGTQTGDSYCALCQTVQELGLDARCYAVAPREATEESSPSDLAALRRHHDRLYSEFSQILEVDPGQALHSFASGSIDLLHLYGSRSYGAAAKQFEAWLPKLSKRAIVLLNGIGAGAPDPGMSQLWAELRQRYPHIEFSHAGGLGLLQVGEEVPAGLAVLLALRGPEQQAFRSLFARLGEILAAYADQLQTTHALSEQVSDSNAQVRELEDALLYRVAERDRTIQYLEVTLKTIQGSKSYRLVRGLQDLRQHVISHGSRTEQTARTLAHSLRRASRLGLRGLLSRLGQRLLPSRKGHASEHPQQSLYASTGDRMREAAEQLAEARLRAFLASDSKLELPRYSQPVVSIILLFYNRAEMSFQCLESVARTGTSIPFEVVIVDNASTDQTASLLDRVKNAKIIRNPANIGFGGGCNQAAGIATGQYLLFLNNDTELLPDAIQALLDTIRSQPNIGAVGGKLILPDGRLQEAGSIIWSDGSCLGYGRYDNPFMPEYCYRKDMDFCSGALLLTPRELFLSCGKFDGRYQPAYYEDADYCMTLWDRGYRVVYQPGATAIHFEFGAEGMSAALEMQTKNREIFRAKWQQALRSHYDPAPYNILFARTHRSDCKRILFVDDQIPDYRTGAGMPRTYEILRAAAQSGYALGFFPLLKPHLIPDIARSLQQQGVEVLYDLDDKRIDLESFLKSRSDYYDIIFISRPHNMREAKNLLTKHARRAKIIYDAEAIFSVRETKFKELQGKPLDDAARDAMFRSEVALADGADLVTTVSEPEKSLFEQYGVQSIQILSHVVKAEPTPAPFEDRRDILFIGGILDSPSPNQDAVSYFVREILPLVWEEIQCDFHVVGSNRIGAIWDLASEHVHIQGAVNDLTPYYNACRLFVVPTRYSAGIPLKLVETAAHGLPAVVTPLAAQQIGWQEGREILVGHDPQDFASKVVALYSHAELFHSIRENALERVRSEYGPERFHQQLRSVLDQVLATAGNGPSQ